jgi:hypothetical protein
VTDEVRFPASYASRMGFVTFDVALTELGVNKTNQTVLIKINHTGRSSNPPEIENLLRVSSSTACQTLEVGLPSAPNLIH